MKAFSQKLIENKTLSLSRIVLSQKPDSPAFGQREAVVGRLICPYVFSEGVDKATGVILREQMPQCPGGYTDTRRFRYCP